MTSLQKQLARIASSSTHELDLKAQKSAYSKSLLFEPSVAATQSLDTLYQICIEGFEELRTLDIRFSRFERSIFGQQSKKEDRELMTAKENEELDTVLESFLGLVGARLLLKPALKAVEWLLRRFRVHEYNTECLILTFLPYHTTPLFPTLLAILPKQLSAAFKFLHPYMNSLVNPSRNVIMYAAAQNPGFFVAVNRYLLNVARARYHYPILLSFWTSTMAQTINSMLTSSLSGRKKVQRQREEDLLTRILPVLNEALSIKKIPELVLACYTIVAVLIGKANLDDRTLDALMSAVTLSWTTETRGAGFSCLALIAEHKQHTNLPKAVLKSILTFEALGEHLERLGKHQSAQKFLLAIADGTIHRLEDKEVQRPAIINHLLYSHVLDENQKNHIRKLIIPPASSQAAVEADVDLAVEAETAQDNYNIDVEAAQRPAQESAREFLVPGNAQYAPGLSLPSSFLVSPALEAYEKLAATFTQSSSLPARIKEFVDDPNLQRSHAAESPLFLSFMIRLWCMHPSISTRCAALRIATERVNAVDFKNVDLQVVVPYILVALADQSTKVRREAANLTIILDQLYDEASTKDVQNTERRWDSGNNSVFGAATERLEWLSHKDIAHFIRWCLVPGLEECVTDPEQVPFVLQRALGNSSHGKEVVAKDTAKQVSSSQRTAIFTFLCSHIYVTPLYVAKLSLLSMVNRVDKVGGHPRSKFLMSYIRQWAAADHSVVNALCGQEYANIRKLDAQFLATIHPSDQEAVSYLLSLAEAEDSGSHRLQRAAFYRLRTIWPLLNHSKQKAVAAALLEMSGSDGSDEESRVRTEESISLLKLFSIPSDILLLFIEEALEQFGRTNLPSAPKQRRVNSGGSMELSANNGEHNDLCLAKLTLVLEVVDGAKAEAHPELFYSLFGVLRVLHDYKNDTLSDLGYLQTLVLSIMSSIMSKFVAIPKSPALNNSLIRTDLLVDCVRNTTDPQARSAALLLLSSLARYSPQLVLLSVMPIFTLMSTTTIRQSDDYSAHIVDQTIREIIPLLATPLRNQQKELVSAAAEILLSFAAAFDHIPQQRRLRLFTLLATSLGAEESLFAIIATLNDRFPGNAQVERFATHLLRQFTSVEALTTISKYLDLTFSSSQPVPSLYTTLIRTEASKSQRMQSPLELLLVVPRLLKDEVFQSKLQHDLLNDPDIAITLRTLFGKLLECTIKLSRCADSSHTRSACASILDCLVHLLPFDEFANSLEPLLDDMHQDLFRSVLKSLELRINSSGQLENSSKTAVLHFLPRLCLVLETSDSMLLKYNAIACIDRICERFGKTSPMLTYHVAQVVVGPHCLGSNDLPLRTLSLYCLASIVDILRNDFIPLLQQALEAAAGCLRESLSNESPSSKLHNASYSYFTSVVDCIPFMVPQSFIRTTFELSLLSAAAALGQEATMNRSQFLQSAATRLDLNSVFSVAKLVWPSAMKHGNVATLEYVNLLRLAVENHSKSTINRDTRTLCDVFFDIFDLRRLRYEDHLSELYSDAQMDFLEESAIETFLALILKINDAVFRPVLMRLIEWSTAALPKQDGLGKTLRSTTLYNFLGALSDRLKSLVTVYFGYVLEGMSEVLRGDWTIDPQSQALRISVLRALSSSFRHDQDGTYSTSRKRYIITLADRVHLDFWQAPSHFNAIVSPLVSQLSSAPISQIYAEVVPAITNFAGAASSSDHHKELNALLLKLVRSENARVRLAAVKCQQSLTQKLGDEWLGLLPEMLPLINELQDDDDEAVERETLSWIKLIESILGESLNSMLQ